MEYEIDKNGGQRGIFGGWREARRVSSERKNTGLRVALASYDVHQLRVWHQYIVEQSAEILCSEYRSGEELLQSLKQGRNTEVVVLGGPLEDMDSREFLERMSRLPQKPLLLLQDNARRERTAVSSLSPDGPCYLIRQSSLKELLASLLTAAGQEPGTAGAALWPDVSGVGHHPAGQQL